MGSRTRLALIAFAERTGIHPNDEDAADLRRAQQNAFDLIRVIELELSGIRDGDGYWYGCDPVKSLVDEIHDAIYKKS